MAATTGDSRYIALTTYRRDGRPVTTGEVADAKPIVRDERLQRGREIVEERSRLEVRFERPPDRGDTDENLGLRRRRRGACGRTTHPGAPATLQRTKADAASGRHAARERSVASTHVFDRCVTASTSRTVTSCSMSLPEKRWSVQERSTSL